MDGLLQLAGPGLEPRGVALGVAACALAFWGTRVVTRALRRRTILRRLARAAAGERRAAALLQAEGYEVIGAQVAARISLAVDGVEAGFDVRADYVVRKSGKTFVAEVKTGALAPKLDAAATRRQLLEYAVAFGTDGVLLVDAESDRIFAVDFFVTQRKARAARSLVPVFAIAALLGTAVAIATLAVASRESVSTDQR